MNEHGLSFNSTDLEVLDELRRAKCVRVFGRKPLLTKDSPNHWFCTSGNIIGIGSTPAFAYDDFLVKLAPRFKALLPPHQHGARK